jgi:hypothetical protein
MNVTIWVQIQNGIIFIAENLPDFFGLASYGIMLVSRLFAIIIF